MAAGEHGQQQEHNLEEQCDGREEPRPLKPAELRTHDATGAAAHAVAGTHGYLVDADQFDLGVPAYHLRDRAGERGGHPIKRKKPQRDARRERGAQGRLVPSSGSRAEGGSEQHQIGDGEHVAHGGPLPLQLEHLILLHLRQL